MFPGAGGQARPFRLPRGVPHCADARRRALARARGGSEFLECALRPGLELVVFALRRGRLPVHGELPHDGGRQGLASDGLQDGAAPLVLIGTGLAEQMPPRGRRTARCVERGYDLGGRGGGGLSGQNRGRDEERRARGRSSASQAGRVHRDWARSLRIWYLGPRPTRARMCSRS